MRPTLITGALIAAACSPPNAGLSFIPPASDTGAAVSAGVSSDAESSTGSDESSSGTTLGVGNSSSSSGAPILPVTMLDWTFRTETYVGQFEPANCIAVWVMTDAAVFVKSLLRRCEIEDVHLIEFIAQTGQNLQPDIDAITSPTPENHLETHARTWDLRDFMGNPVPDGDYVLWAEMSESNSAVMGEPPGRLLQIPFSLGTGHFTELPGGPTPGFLGASLDGHD